MTLNLGLGARNAEAGNPARGHPSSTADPVFSQLSIFFCPEYSSLQ